jgi:hypothetical protein
MPPQPLPSDDVSGRPLDDQELTAAAGFFDTARTSMTPAARQANAAALKKYPTCGDD